MTGKHGTEACKHLGVSSDISAAWLTSLEQTLQRERPHFLSRSEVEKLSVSDSRVLVARQTGHTAEGPEPPGRRPLRRPLARRDDANGHKLPTVATRLGKITFTLPSTLAATSPRSAGQAAGGLIGFVTLPVGGQAAGQAPLKTGRGSDRRQLRFPRKKLRGTSFSRRLACRDLDRS
jgi:hypothetical protein